VADEDKAARKRDAMKCIATVQQILRRWDPIGVRPGEFAPDDEYDSYAPPIVSMVVQGCTLEQLCKHLGVLRGDTIGVELNPRRDREVAAEILEALRDKAV
jgi:hypothetical protein